MKENTENWELKQRSQEFQDDIDHLIFTMQGCNEENKIEELKHGLLDAAMNEFIWSETFIELTQEKREDFHGQFQRLRFLLDIVQKFASDHPCGKKEDYIEISNPLSRSKSTLK